VNQALAQKTSRIALTSGILYALLQVLDIAITYRITPDLHHEANILVARFDLGWGFIISSATVLSLFMIVAQFWVWHTLRARFPDRIEGYNSFYRHIFYLENSTHEHREHDLKGILAGLLLILLYSLITAKLLVVVWNFSLVLFTVSVDDFTHAILVKNLLSGLVGLYMFFVYLFWLSKRY
jgi:hypothetical protein